MYVVRYWSSHLTQMSGSLGASLWPVAVRLTLVAALGCKMARSGPRLPSLVASPVEPSFWACGCIFLWWCLVFRVIMVLPLGAIAVLDAPFPFHPLWGTTPDPMDVHSFHAKYAPPDSTQLVATESP